ncbi:PorT family protein [Cryomorphaceae bacterium]|nr:PorT family protein [Cryomorphaceae bacterium]
MKKALLSLFVVLAFSTTYGQVFQLGARAGVGRSDIRINEELSIPGGATVEVRPGEPRTAFHVGAYTRFKVLGFYVQPELLYTNLPAEVDFINTATQEEADVIVNINRLDIPVLVGIKLGPIRLNAGPTFNTILSTSDDADGGDLEFATASFGWQYGVGVDLGKFLIDLKAEGSFDDPVQGVNDGNTSYDLNGNMHQVLLSIGYRIL